jgi:hypothetical protein
MSEVFREFGISRKTGYKIFQRYKESGFEALNDRCRRPVRYANQLPPQIEGLILACKREKPHWGARKIRELLVRRFQGRIQARQRPVLLPAHGPRSRLPIPAAVRGPGVRPGRNRHHRLGATLPRARPAAAIRSDNGVPFASCSSLFGLSSQFAQLLGSATRCRAATQSEQMMLKCCEVACLRMRARRRS